MFKENTEKLIVDPDDNNPVAIFIDSTATALGIESQSGIVICRLYHKDWPTHAGVVPREQVHQFAMSARCAAVLGQQLLELAAQAEKDSGVQSH